MATDAGSEVIQLLLKQQALNHLRESERRWREWAELHGYKFKPLTRWQRYKLRWGNRRRQAIDAWAVLRGKAYADYE